MENNKNRLWIFAEQLEKDKILNLDNAFIIKAPRNHKGLTIILDEDRLSQTPNLNNKPKGFENVNYILYVYGNSGNLQEAESLSNKIYQYLLKNPKIDQAYLKGISPKSPEFIFEGENERPAYIVEFSAIYITQFRLEAGQALLNGLLNMSF